MAIVVAASLVFPGAALAQDGDRDCEDFSSQQEAQEYHESPQGEDDRLDSDGDGQACEDFDYGSGDARASQYPGGGIHTGGGSTSGSATDALPAVIGGAGVIALVGTGVLFGLRRILPR